MVIVSRLGWYFCTRKAAPNNHILKIPNKSTPIWKSRQRKAYLEAPLAFRPSKEFANANGMNCIKILGELYCLKTPWTQGWHVATAHCDIMAGRRVKRAP